ncbi:MAG: hypothetical protein Q9219_006962, partial [cf. Caloplaca sp. 3 TL-2023]
ASAIKATKPARIANVGLLEFAAPVNGAGEFVTIVALGKELTLGMPLDADTGGGTVAGTSGWPSGASLIGGLVTTGGAGGAGEAVPPGCLEEAQERSWECLLREAVLPGCLEEAREQLAECWQLEAVVPEYLEEAREQLAECWQLEVAQLGRQAAVARLVGEEEATV